VNANPSGRAKIWLKKKVLRIEDLSKNKNEGKDMKEKEPKRMDWIRNGKTRERGGRDGGCHEFEGR